MLSRRFPRTDRRLWRGLSVRDNGGRGKETNQGLCKICPTREAQVLPVETCTRFLRCLQRRVPVLEGVGHKHVGTVYPNVPVLNQIIVLEVTVEFEGVEDEVGNCSRLHYLLPRRIR